MSEFPNRTPTRKTLRRKPPPSLDRTQPVSGFGSPPSYIPSVVAMPSDNGPNETIRNGNLKINTSPSLNQYQNLPDLSKHQEIYDFSGHREDQEMTRPSSDPRDLSSTHDELEESFLSYESPKPMGPRDLPDYNDLDSPYMSDRPQIVTRHSMSAIQRDRVKPTRKFQSLLHKSVQSSSFNNNPSLPYPTTSLTDLALNSDNDYNDSFNRDNDDDAYDFFNPNITKTSPKRRLSFSGASPNIPELAINGSLKSQVSMPSLQKNDSYIKSGHSSPFRSSTIRLDGRTSRRSSPTRTQTLNLSTRNSPEFNHMYTPERSKSSRSPSPKKLYGRSPSLIYESNFYEQENTYDDGEYAPIETSNMRSEYVYDEDYDESDRPTRWGSMESENTYKTEISDYYYNDNYFDNYDYSYNDNDDQEYDGLPMETPINAYFDYSILPDLPSPSQEPRPTASLAVQSALSFVGNKQDIPTKTPALTKERKNEELPPVPLDLPQLPFSSSSLVSQHFSTCENVWSLNDIFHWCLKLKIWLHDLFISKREFKKALIKLVVFHKRDIPLDLIGHNVDRIIEGLTRSKAIIYDYGIPVIKKDDDDDDDDKPLPTVHEGKRGSKEEPGIIMDENAYVSGVMVELTACYCHDEDHSSHHWSHKSDQKLTKDNKLKLRCYSSQCTLNKLIDHKIILQNTNINEIVLGEDWASHWKLTAEDLRMFDKNISKRQSLIFDLLRYEQTFIERASCFVELVGPEFIKAAQVLIGSHEIVLINKFEDDVLKPGEEIVKIHKENLFHPLLRVLIADGKFISNLTEISKIYSQWSQVVKKSLLKYMSTVPMIEDLLKYEGIKKWVDHNVRNMKRVKDLKVNGPLLFMSTFNSRYQSLPLQLSDIKKSFDPQDQEYVSLTKAIDEIKKIGLKVNEMKIHADNIYSLKRINKQLTWKSNIHQPNINLGSENRKFFLRGDLSRKGDLKINTYVNHIILLDNYLFITERVRNTRASGYSYRVTENPIPIELLLVELKETSSTTGIEISLSKTLTLNNAPPTPMTANSESVNDEDPSYFPIKIRYAGRGKHNAFTFLAKSERERTEWVNHLMQARTNLCSRLRKNELYNLNLISNSNFAYDVNNRIMKLQVCAPNDPLEAMATDSVSKLKSIGYKGDIYSMSDNKLTYSKCLTLTRFNYKGTQFHMIGLASGVYCSDGQNMWKKVISGIDITKISVVTSINLVVILGNKNLRYYALDLIVNVYYERKQAMTSISLSNEPVSFFSIGRHREIIMLFYAKKKSNSSGTTNFKVLIPETDNDGVFNTFKMVKKFYVEAECFGISIFNTSFAVHTGKGFEILELDKLIPRSIPDLPNNDSPTPSSKKIDGYGRRLIQSGSSLSTNSTSSTSSNIEVIRKIVHSTSVKPMGMFKLANNSEFLLVYNDCAIFTNKHGKLSRFSMLKFEYKAKAIAFQNNNLFLVCDEVIEVWSISDFVNGTNRLIQVVTGKDITLLDNIESLCFAVADPKVPGLQMVFSLDPKNGSGKHQ